MEPPSFSNLPTDLFSLIRTQSRINECFRAGKDIILSAVAHNFLQPHLLKDASITLRCLEARRTRKVDKRSKTHAHFRALSQIITEANKNLASQPQLSMIELTPFFQYHRCVETFVPDYTSRHILKYGGPAFTTVELYRLRRGFYRHDTFQTMNYFASLMSFFDRNTVV